MSDTRTLLETLKDWSERHWIRRLDSAFASFMVELDPQAPAPVVMAAALVAHLEGRGHTCLPIDDLLTDAPAVLGWAPPACASLREVMASLPRRAEDWLDALRSSPLVAQDGPAAEPGVGVAMARAAAEGRPPLVLRGAKLYLRRYWQHERHVAAQVLWRSADRVAVDVVAARHWLDRLFPLARPGPVDWQKVACAIALRARLSIVTGGPGTGKTHTAARLLALLFAMDGAPQRLRVALAAPTGKAAARLRQSISAALQALQPLLADTPALTGLADRIGPARTLHALLGARADTRRFQTDAAHPLEIDVLIVDEASMIHLEMMAALLDALAPQARVVFLGDQDQLASVEAGAVLGDLCHGAGQGSYSPDTAAYVEAVTGQPLAAESIGCERGNRLGHGPALAQQTVMLRDSHRFGGHIGSLARAVMEGDVSAATALLQPSADSPPHMAAAPARSLAWLDAPASSAVVRLTLRGRPGAPGGYGTYLQVVKQRPAGADAAAHDAWVRSVLAAFERFRVLCAVHDGDSGTVSLNAAIEHALQAEGLLVKRGAWYEGRPVMVTRNDADLGVFNGDIGIVLKPFAGARSGDHAATHAVEADSDLSPVGPGSSLRAYFANGSAVRSVGVSRIAEVETAFAMTVHKAQGSEFEHTVLVLPETRSRAPTRELVYTGITRARLAFTLVTGERDAFAAALGRRMQRSSGLLEMLNALQTGAEA